MRGIWFLLYWISFWWTLWSYDDILYVITTLQLEQFWIWIVEFVLLLRQNFVNNNFWVVFCIMDYEGHLLNVNKIYDFFLWKKKCKLSCSNEFKVNYVALTTHLFGKVTFEVLAIHRGALETLAFQGLFRVVSFVYRRIL